MSEYLNKKNSNLILITILGLSTALYYILYIYIDVGFSTDSAVRMLYAREALESESYFPSEWNYVNKDIWNFDQTLIARIFLLYLPVSYQVYVLINIISLLLFYIFAIIFIKNICKNITGQLQAVALVSTGISFPLANQIFGEMAYGFFVIYFFIILTAVWIILTTENHRLRAALLLVLSLVIIALAWSNPVRTMVYIVVPLLTVFGISYCFAFVEISGESDQNKRMAIAAFVLLSATTTGYILHNLVSQYIQPAVGYGTSLTLTHYKQYPAKFASLALGFISLAGGEVGFGLSRKSIPGLYQTVRLIGAIFLLSLVVLQLIRSFLGKNEALKFVLMFSCVSLLIICVIRVTLNELQNNRYLIPPFLILIMALATQPLPEIRIRLFKFLFVALMIILFSNSVAICTKEIWQQFEKNAARSVGYPLYQSIDKLTEYLIEKNDSYGYATYWRAGVITALSREQVKVRQIGIRDGIVVPQRWHSSNRWYDESYYSGPTFLLLTPEEYNSIDWKKMQKLGMVPISIETHYEYIILNYTTNIARYWNK